MNHLSDWTRHHQVAAFFVITFAITWGLGFSYDAVINKGADLLAPLVFIATCGPALAGIIVSTICNNQPKQGKKRTTWLAYIIAWVISAFICLANITFINHSLFSPVLVAFIFVAVVPVAFVISMAYSRIPGVKSYLASLVQLRGVWGWILVGSVLFPGIFLLSTAISSLLGLTPASASHLPRSGLTLIGLISVTFLYQLFFFNATGEETGWRGFALPRLQARTTPLIAALIIGFFWTSWHFSLWQAEGRPVFNWRFWSEMYIVHMLGSLIIVWVCNRAGGSILVAGVTHAAANTVQAFIPMPDGRVLLSTCLVTVLVMILTDQMWKKLPSDHPAVYQMPALDS
jgi:membrane protease YdiL (CAAX protease family)